MTINSNLERLLREDQFVVTTEIGPPKNACAKAMRHKAKMLKNYIDAANITDCQAATARLSSIAGGLHLLNKGIEPIIQMTCRDRNRIAMQADIMGAYSLGIRNLLCLSGDHQKFGNHPTSKNVYDIDSIQLVYLTRRMRDKKLFFSGDLIKGQEPRFFIGAVANPFADPFEYRIDRLEKKVNAGAEFIQTQSIFDMERFERFMEMVVDRGIHERVYILPGITPLKSWRAAEFMRNNISGMMIPDKLIERMKNASDPKAEGIKIAIEQINIIKSMKGIHGVHIMAIAWEEVVPEIVRKCGLYPRPLLCGKE